MAAAHPVLHPPFSERVVYDRTAATRTLLRAPRDPGARYAGIAFTILVHVALIAALLQYPPVQRALAKVKPIMVSVITPQPTPPEPPRPKQTVAAKTVRMQAPPPGEKVAEPPPVAAETTAATVILTAAHFGMPVSTTHVISSAIMGVGTVRGARGVRWGVARSILVAWIFTIPAAGLVAMVAWLLLHLVGLG